MSDIDINNLFGVLFKNESKNKDTDADYQGNFSYNEAKIAYISAWIKTSKTSGKKFLALKLKEIGSVANEEKISETGPDYKDDDIPF